MFEITSTEEVGKGRVYYLVVNGRRLQVMVTWHAEGRASRWKLQTEVIIETLLYPEEVLTGHHNRYIAHKRYGTGTHLIRAVYEYEGELPVLVTVYFPLTERYFKGGGTHADKILP